MLCNGIIELLSFAIQKFRLKKLLPTIVISTAIESIHLKRKLSKFGIIIIRSTCITYPKFLQQKEHLEEFLHTGGNPVESQHCQEIWSPTNNSGEKSRPPNKNFQNSENLLKKYCILSKTRYGNALTFS